MIHMLASNTCILCKFETNTPYLDMESMTKIIDKNNY